ncbi:MAG: hypothetical protein AB7K24_14585 [Gemmataceae bacterium]
MNLLGQTLILYLVVGVAIAGAMYLVDGPRPGRWFRVATTVPFWPLYLPLLLARAQPPAADEPISPSTDDMDAAISQVDGELEAALGSLDGWAEDVLAREKNRIRELRRAWAIQAERIREMDRLLARDDGLLPALDQAASERLRNSQRNRQQNIERLRQVRRRAHDDLIGTLAWVRELVSMIHLAKFTGAPAARAEELIAQIASAVEGLSELTWQEELTVS